LAQRQSCRDERETNSGRGRHPVQSGETLNGAGQRIDPQVDVQKIFEQRKTRQGSHHGAADQNQPPAGHREASNRDAGQRKTDSHGQLHGGKARSDLNEKR